MPNKVLIAEDHPMTLKGIRLLVEVCMNRELVQDTATCRQLLKELSSGLYSHLILDIMLADGSALEVIPTIRNLYPELEIMVFSGQPSGLYKRALVRYRIGYILSKGMREKETLRLLRQFLHNEKRLSRPVTAHEPSPAIKDASIPFAGMPAREI